MLTNVSNVTGRFSVYTSGNVVTIWGGTNDISSNGGTAVSVYNNLVSYCQAVRAKGFKVIVVTLISRGDAAAIAAGYDSIRTTLNANIVATWTTFADGMMDAGADANIGGATSYNNATYFQADKVHLTNTGYAIVAALGVTQVQNFGLTP